MIKRIVKLTFQPDQVHTFLQIFEESKDEIRNFPGCQHMELLRCPQPESIFFTLSIWNDENALDAYRQSAVFQHTWSRTKVLFRDKPEAWTVELVDG